MPEVNKEKKTIRALLQSVKFGLTSQQLWKDYVNLVGRECPYQDYGFNSFVDFLRSMPDVCRFITHGGAMVLVPVANAETRHISKMVANQKFTTGSNYKRPNKREASIKKVVPLDLQARLKKLMMGHPNGIPIAQFQMLFSKRYGFNLIPEKFGYATLDDFVRNGLPTLKMEPDVTGKIMMVKIVEDLEDLSLDVIRPIRKPRSLMGTTPQATSQSNTKMASSWSSQRKSSSSEVISLSHSLSTNLSLNDIDRSPIKPPTLDVFKQEMDKKYNHKPGVPESFKGVLWRLLKQYPEGVPIKCLKEYYRRYAHEDLPVLGLGFDSTDEFVAAVPDVMVTKSTPDGVLLFPTSNSPTEVIRFLEIEGSCGNSEEPKEEETEQPLPSSPKFSRPCLPKEDMINVVVTYVVDPENFYVQLLEESLLEQLQALQEDLMLIYSNSSTAQQYHLSDWAVGQSCIAMFSEDSRWYRAEILRSCGSDKVEVYFVDYGNSDTVPSGVIKKPRPYHFSLPAYAIECTVAKVVPNGSKIWSPRAVDFFKMSTSDKALVAWVKHVEQQGRLHLSLCDTSTDVDIHIGDELVKRGYGKICKLKSSPTPISSLPTSTTTCSLATGAQKNSLHATPVSYPSQVSHPQYVCAPPPLAPAYLPLHHHQLQTAYWNQIMSLQQQQQQNWLFMNSLQGREHMFGSQPLIPILTSVSTSTSNPVFDSVLESKGSDSNQDVSTSLTGGVGQAWLGTQECNPLIEIKNELEALKDQRKRLIQEMSVASSSNSDIGNLLGQLSLVENSIRMAQNRLNTFQPAASHVIQSADSHVTQSSDSRATSCPTTANGAARSQFSSFDSHSIGANYLGLRAGTPSVRPGTPSVRPGTPSVRPGTPSNRPGIPSVRPDTPSNRPGIPGRLQSNMFHPTSVLTPPSSPNPLTGGPKSPSESTLQNEWKYSTPSNSRGPHTLTNKGIGIGRGTTVDHRYYSQAGINFI